MKRVTLSGLMLILAVSVMFGCQGGTSADPNAPAIVTLSASKAVALADGKDAVTVQADVKKADGTAVDNGTFVTFAVPVDSGTLSQPLTATVNGQAFVTVTRTPVQGANNQTVSVTGTSGGISNSAGVKFVNQPSSVVVSVSFNKEVTNLSALSFKLNNTAGAAFNNSTQPVAAINGAEGSMIIANFNAAANNNTIGMVSVNPNGIPTGSKPIIRAEYTINAGSGLPSFNIDTDLATFTATDINGKATVPAVTAADLVISAAFDTEL